MPRTLRLDPDAPIASLLEHAGLSQSELGRRLGYAHRSGVGRLLDRGGDITLGILHRAAKAAGFRVVLRVEKIDEKKDLTPLEVYTQSCTLGSWLDGTDPAARRKDG